MTAAGRGARCAISPSKSSKPNFEHGNRNLKLPIRQRLRSCNKGRRPSESVTCGFGGGHTSQVIVERQSTKGDGLPHAFRIEGCDLLSRFSGTRTFKRLPERTGAAPHRAAALPS